MKKKLLALVILIFTLFSLNSCNRYHGPQGQLLNKNQPVATHIKFLNKSNQPVFIASNRGNDNDFFQIEPGRQFAFSGYAKKEAEYIVRWFYEYNFNSEKKKVEIERTGLYSTGETIIIDDLFLRNMMLQAGVVHNSSAQAVKVWDSQGNHYGVLQPGEASAVTKLVPIPTTFFWLSTKGDIGQKRATSHCLNIDEEMDNFWQGRPIGWICEIYTSKK